jgi:hypothetical protein
MVFFRLTAIRCGLKIRIEKTIVPRSYHRHANGIIGRDGETRVI